MTKGVLEEKFVSEFFCPYFIGNLHAVTEHGEVVVKGVFAVNLLPDGLTGCLIVVCFIRKRGAEVQVHYDGVPPKPTFIFQRRSK